MGLSTQELDRLKQHFGAAASEVLVEGDDPLLLVDPGFVYITQVPHHQLFCVGHEAGAAVGRREHVALCGPGQLLAGMTPGPAVLLLSGAAGSHVLRIPTELCFDALDEPGIAELIQRSFDELMALLVSALPSAPVPTRCEAVLPDASIADASVPLRAATGVVWVELTHPPTRYGGVDVEPSESTPLTWPLTETTWIVGAGPARTVGGAKLLADDHTAAVARSFATFVVDLLGDHRKELEQERLLRDAASHAAEGQFVSDSLHLLAHVGRGERLAPDIGRGEAFEMAVKKIAVWLEMPIPPVPKPKGNSLSSMQGALSRLTGVRTRGVLLEDDWYNHDSGALLGFMLGEEDELNPVALFPTALGYELDDPRSDGRVRVRAAETERLHPQAYQFYAPLPDRPITPLDVLRFSSRRARRDIVFTLAVGLGLGSLATLIPLLTGQVFDTLIPGAERGLLLQLTLLLGCVYAGQSLLDIARGLAMVRAQTRMDVTLEAGVWDRLLSLPLPFFREYSAGDLGARAGGIGAIRDVLAGTTLAALLSGLFSLWNLGFLFVIDPSLALASTLLVAIAAIPAVIATRIALKRQRAVAEVDGKIEGLLLQLFNGVSKLRVTSAENRAFSVWARLFARRRDEDLRAEWVGVRMSVFQSIFPTVCSVVLFGLLAGGGEQKISTGQFLAFSAAFGIFLGSALHVIDAILHSLIVIPLYERAKPILTARSESQGGGVRPDLKGGIEINHVSFRYDPKGPLILDDVSIQIKADEFVALVGPSGSGKSTLLRMLLGFETPTEGGVYYDGQALTGLDIRIVRKQIGVVMQNSRVMPGDIFSNIVGATGASQDDAWAAARASALDTDIEAMPMGMHTVISQGGGTLSGGQKQRLLIARSLATKPRILFFDEATSALDNVTQAVVSQSLETLRVTRVVIAHRLSTIRNADKIVVLEKGRVVQSGRFEELMAVEGPFRTLAKRQTL